MPAYNAEKTLEKTYNEIYQNFVDEIILVDDFSSDNTKEIAKDLNITTIVHEQNKGYGGNQKSCYRAALKAGADIVIMLHPDYQYTPKLIPAIASMMAFGEYDGLPKAQNGVGDPAILVDKKTGTIWIVAAWTHGMGNGRAWWNSQTGMDRNHTAQLMMVKSDDDGKTWSEPMNVTEQVKDPSWYFLLQGPGRGISMEDGTLVFASQYIGSDRIPNAGIIYSKDHGKTWKISTLARTNTTESQVAEVEPGVLMLNMRDNRGGSRAVSTTTDMGKTWKEHVSSRTALQEPVCMASLISVKAEDNVLGKDILLFSNPNDTKNRHSITIKASLDGGVTWLPENQLLLDAGWGWGYSCLTMIDKETVGILYESSVAHMTFQAVKLKDIIKTK